jgi:hypothetical protein
LLVVELEHQVQELLVVVVQVVIVHQVMDLLHYKDQH